MRLPVLSADSTMQASDAAGVIAVVPCEKEGGMALPSAQEFLALIEDERSVTAASLSSYSVYHKYNKSC